MHKISDNTVTNTQFAKIFSVNEISNIIRQTLENNLGSLKIRGEISGLKIASSGHAYFNLKDNTAIICCTCWRHKLLQIKPPLAEGTEIIATGKITAYAGQSRYQFTVEEVSLAGLGAWMQILTERRNRLEKEGLFAIENKKQLPFAPSKVGVITSMVGVVIKDIIHRITDRFPTNIIIWPVTVQGSTCAAEVVEAIEGFNKLDVTDRPEVIIIARGGGSVEDLWAFNEEIIVHSVVASEIAIISAIGHETDYTLIDLAADKRAPTPTAAAEFAVPVAEGIIYNLKLHYNSLVSAVTQLLRLHKQKLANYNNILNYSRHYIDPKQQRLDEASINLAEALPNLLYYKENNLAQLATDKLNPKNYIAYRVLQLENLYSTLLRLRSKILETMQHRLELNSKLLASLDYNNTLKRGFAIIKNEEGRVLTSKNSLTMGKLLNIEFHDGKVKVKSLGI